MKYLIFGIVTVLCVQAIQGNDEVKDSVKKQCESDLRKLRKETKSFFEQFKAKHDIGIQHLSDIEELCGRIMATVQDNAKSHEQIRDENKLRCEVKKFLDAFKQDRETVLGSIKKLQVICNELRKMIDKFENDSKVNFRGSKSKKDTGCESDIKKLLCELTKFIKVIKGQFDVAVKLLLSLEMACTTIGELTDKFENKHQPVCLKKGDNNCNETGLKNDVKTLYDQLNNQLETSHTDLKVLSDICSIQRKTIDEWISKI